MTVSSSALSVRVSNQCSLHSQLAVRVCHDDSVHRHYGNRTSIEETSSQLTVVTVITGSSFKLYDYLTRV